MTRLPMFTIKDDYEPLPVFSTRDIEQGQPDDSKFSVEEIARAFRVPLPTLTTWTEIVAYE